MSVYVRSEGFPGGSVKNPLAIQGSRFYSWVGKIPWRRKQQPTPVFLTQESYRQRSQAGYSSWGGHKKSDMTKQLTLTGKI